MKKQILKYLGSAVLGLLLIVYLSQAQVRAFGKLPRKGAPSPAARVASREARQTKTSGSPSYTFTLLNYPGQLFTNAIGINKGATTSKVAIAGGYGYNVETESGFLVRLSGKKTVTEAYQTVNDPKGIFQLATGVNDLGQIVGWYEDSSGLLHGYEKSSGKFTELNVSFEGASGTFVESINNSGEIVGVYSAADGEGYGFSLIGGTYTSLNYPGATYTEANDVNTNGDIVGLYIDASGINHGFLLSGGTYTSIDFPGATGTYANGINDSGDIAGTYCPSGATDCLDTEEGAQGFLLSGGTFTSIVIPNEFFTDVTDINNDGVVVGYYQDAAGVNEGFMATP